MTGSTPTATGTRYPGRRTRVWVPIAAVLVVIGLGWLGWAGWYGATRTVSARVDAFTVLSDTRMQVTVTVQRPDATAVQCLLFAQAVTYERVAELPVVVPSGGGTLVTATYTLNTIRRATSADIEGCRAAG